MKNTQVKFFNIKNSIKENIQSNSLKIQEWEKYQMKI